jgi:hypothetical protein
LTLPPYVPRDVVLARLQAIFPAGSPKRTFLTREMAGSTVFAMLYVGAVEGGRYLSPKQVYRMSDEQAAMTSNESRIEYADDSERPGFAPRGRAWYADNSREPIRDETLRQGLVAMGAAMERSDIPTTSGKGRYCLASDFARLFDPDLTREVLDAAIAEWRRVHLSPSALARISIVRAGAGGDKDGVLVEFPGSGETRRLGAGDSSRIAKGVIQSFAPAFLTRPAVLWLSESANKVVSRDDLLAKKIGLNIDAARNLPDIILVDLGADGDDLLLVFVEVVSTDGAVTEERRAALFRLAADAGFAPHQVAFVTAFLDRAAPALRKNLDALAWNSFVWIASEPECIIGLVGPIADTSKRRRLLPLLAPEPSILNATQTPKAPKE